MQRCQEKTFIPFRTSGTSANHSVLFAKNNSPNCFLNAQIIDSQCEWGIRIVLFAKNSPLDCFFNAQTVIKEIKVFIKYQCSPILVGIVFYFYVDFIVLSGKIFNGDNFGKAKHVQSSLQSGISTYLARNDRLFVYWYSLRRNVRRKRI